MAITGFPLIDSSTRSTKLNCVSKHPETIDPDHENQSDTTPAEKGIEHQPTGAAARRESPELSKTIALTAARVAAENNGLDIVVLDMTRHTAIFDYFVIVTGTSRRQLHAISEDIDKRLKTELKEKRMHIDGYEESRWIVLDYGTVVIHLFDEETRQFYSLEALWGDAEKVDLSATLQGLKTR